MVKRAGLILTPRIINILMTLVIVLNKLDPKLNIGVDLFLVNNCSVIALGTIWHHFNLEF